MEDYAGLDMSLKEISICVVGRDGSDGFPIAEEVQRMRLAPAGCIIEQYDGWAGSAMAAIIGDDHPEK